MKGLNPRHRQYTIKHVSMQQRIICANSSRPDFSGRPISLAIRIPDKHCYFP